VTLEALGPLKERATDTTDKALAKPQKATER